MKTKPTLLICALAVLVASCGSLQGFEKRRYMNGFYVSVTDNKPQAELLSTIKDENQRIVIISDQIIFHKKPEIDSVPEKTDSSVVLTISNKVGYVIDSSEKALYKLFPFWRKEDFAYAQFFQKTDGSIYLAGTMKDGSVKIISYSIEQYSQTAKYTFGEVPSVAYEMEKKKQEEKAQEKQKENDTNKSILKILLLAIIILLFYAYVSLISSIKI